LYISRNLISRKGPKNAKISSAKILTLKVVNYFIFLNIKNQILWIFILPIDVSMKTLTKPGGSTPPSQHSIAVAKGFLPPAWLRVYKEKNLWRENSTLARPALHSLCFTSAKRECRVQTTMFSAQIWTAKRWLVESN